ncbi:MAG: rhomboid family intramembrane serine protease [Armatimonadota bacterium]
MLPFRDYNPSRNFPLVTISLIVVNTLVYLYTVSLNYMQGPSVLNAFIMRMAVVPDRFLQGDIDLPVLLTVLTAMFMHGGPLHLAGNMLFLWIFGNNVEDIMGPTRFLIFYLFCGALATVAHIVSVANNPTMASIPSLGASGAIAGVLGAYLVRFPRAQVDTCVFLFFVFIIRLPALVVIALWFLLQLFSGVAALGNSAQASGVAYWAHIGGFLAGMILVSFFAKRPQTRYN